MVIVPVIDHQADDTERVMTDAVHGLVAELHPYAPPTVRLDSDLERELGLDSLALAELLVRRDGRRMRMTTNCAGLSSVAVGTGPNHRGS